MELFAGQQHGKRSTRQLLVKIPKVPCLYRHELNGTYHAVKKHRGKIRNHALKTEAGLPITDRKIAERKLREWIERLEDSQSPADCVLTFRELLERYKATKSGDSKSTQENVAWMTGHFAGEKWERGLTVRVADIRASDLSSFMAKLSYMKPRSYNTLSAYVKQLFDLAVADRIVAKSPFEHTLNKRKKVRKELRPTPSNDQFQKIVDFIRSQRFSSHAENSADLAEFIGLAGLGEAEAGQLHWRDLDLKQESFQVRRQKTRTWFEVPFYPRLRTFLTDLYERQNHPPDIAKVFQVASVKKALETACKSLGFTHFSPRSLRRRLIVELIRSSVNVKLIAKWQGHQDGGKEILDTYSEVFSESDRQFERQELSKLS